MFSEKENDELKKARFYFEAVAKLDAISTKSYERNNVKINIFIGVLSTVIPILTGVGYIVLSNTVAVPFFVFYIFSLSIFVWALAKCVHLLAPRWFVYVDVGKLMKRYDKETLSVNIFKIASTWEDTIKKNIDTINSLRSDLQQIVRLIIAGLIVLVIALILLGVEICLMSIKTDPVTATTQLLPSIL